MCSFLKPNTLVKFIAFAALLLDVVAAKALHPRAPFLVVGDDSSCSHPRFRGRGLVRVGGHQTELLWPAAGDAHRLRRAVAASARLGPVPPQADRP